MYSLLIVDDEKWVRQGLRSTIDWQAEGVEVLGEAEDGEEALKFIQTRTPDIIITDIKMPRMDGLALIETVKNRNMPSKIIIISGYSDFHSAQKAIRCGASDYVLKPIEETQVLDVVRRCVSEIKQENKEQEQIEQMSELIRESLPLARQRYIEMLLRNVSALNNDWKTLWDRLHIQLNPSRLKVISVKVFDWGSRGLNEKERYLLRYAIANIAEEIGKGMGKTLIISLDHHEDTDLVILQSPFYKNVNATELGMESLIRSCRRYLGIGINIGISQPSEAVNLHEAFQEAVHAGANAFFGGYGKVYDAGNLKPTNLLNQEYKGPSGWDTRFAHALKLGKEAVIGELADELVSHMQMNSSKYSPYRLRKGLADLFSEIGKKMDAGQAAEQQGAKPLQLPYCSLEELKSELLKLINNFRQDYGTSGNRKRFIELAIQFVEEHYTESITMNSVAEYLYLNPSYFSKIFHEETGETFSKYLIRLRIEKTKNLLKDSTLKIYEVAQKVGYQDFRHFVKLFKDQEGITPAQYRDLGVM